MSGQSMMQGVIIMIVCEVTAAILALMGGIVMDNIYKFFGDTGLFATVPANWQSAGQVLSAMNLYRLACIMIALAGIGYFILSIYQREGVDTTRYYYR